MKRLLVLLAALVWLTSPALAIFNSVETFPFSNISSNTAAFTLRGGNYGLTCHATFGGGSVGLQRLAADATTWVNVVTALSADGYTSANLPSGQYRISVTTATGVFCDVTATVTTQ
jgi:hypothetical protein